MPKPKVETRRVSPSSNKLDNEKRRHLKEKREKRKKEMKEDKHHKEPKNKHKEDIDMDSCIGIPGVHNFAPAKSCYDTEYSCVSKKALFYIHYSL